MSGDYLNPDDGEDVASGTDEAEATSAEFEGVDLPPEGDRDVVCLDAKFGRSKKGNSMVTLSLQCPEEPAASADYYLVNTPRAAWRFDDGLKAFGIVRPPAGQKFTLDRKQFVGVKLRGAGVHERNPDFNNGQPTFKYGSLAPAPEGAGPRVFEAE